LWPFTVYGCGVEAGTQPKPFFSEGSPYLEHPLLTAERTSAEVDEIAGLVGSVSGRVLDIGCGFGRHSIELASRFADVTGIDPSSVMIQAARARAAEANQFADFICTPTEDFREVARYDLAICLFTTLGQQKLSRRDDAPHVALLRQAKQALKPGGKFVIELPDKDRAVAALVETEQLGPTKVLRSFDKRESTITEHFKLLGGETYRLIYRVFDKTELVDMLHDVGFEIQQIEDHGLVEPPATFMTFVAERPTV